MRNRFVAGWISGRAALALALLGAGLTAAIADPPGGRDAPATLHETGLYAGPASTDIAPGNLGFAPQYPLWTDGAAKRRWISLPPGTAIDATLPDAWVFPVGTRFWKEFAFEGRPVETRYMEHLADGSWLFASYAWDADGRAATLVNRRGRRNGFDFGGGRWHRIPSVADCHVCHLSGAGPVLGFGALQLSADRDPGALHHDPPPPPGLTLESAVALGLVRGPDATLARPRIADDPRAPSQRAALGYLHGNCGHCHNASGALAALGLVLRMPPGGDPQGALAGMLRQRVAKPPPGLTPGTVFRVEPGRADLSELAQRMGSRHPGLQMPPLGTVLVDEAAVALITRWIAEVGIVSTRDRHFEESEP